MPPFLRAPMGSASMRWFVFVEKRPQPGDMIFFGTSHPFRARSSNVGPNIPRVHRHDCAAFFHQLALAPHGYVFPSEPFAVQQSENPQWANLSYNKSVIGKY